MQVTLRDTISVVIKASKHPAIIAADDFDEALHEKVGAKAKAKVEAKVEPEAEAAPEPRAPKPRRR